MDNTENLESKTLLSKEQWEQEQSNEPINTQDEPSKENKQNNTNIGNVFDFKSAFKQFYKNSNDFSEAFKDLGQNVGKLKMEIDNSGSSHLINFGVFKGAFEDMWGKWVLCQDNATRINDFLNAGISNETLNNLNQFVTIADSSLKAKNAFEEFSKIGGKLEEFNKSANESLNKISEENLAKIDEIFKNNNAQIEDFKTKLAQVLTKCNDQLEKYGLEQTLEKINEENQEVSALINNYANKVKEHLDMLDNIQGSMVAKRRADIDELNAKLSKILDDANISANDVKSSLDQIVSDIEKNAKEKIDDFNKNFTESFDKSLLTFKNLNSKSFGEFKGFMALLMLIFVLCAGITGAGAAYMLNAKKDYELAQAELLKINEGAKWLVKNSESFDFKKEGDQVSLNFVAKQNLTIQKNGQTLNLKAKEE